jgi:putative membrane protein
MHPLLQALFSAWDWRIDVSTVLLAFGALYTAGWLRLRRRSSSQKLARKWRLVAYWGGLVTLAVALMSPVDLLGSQLFFMHMIQHKLEIMVAAPLVCVANPFPFLLWGLPLPLRKRLSGLFTQSARFRALLRQATEPGIAWFVFIAFYMGWHDPGLYNLALVHNWVHDVQHLTFFASAMLFWWHITGAAPHLHGRQPVWVRLAMLIGVIPAQMIAGITIATATDVIYTYYSSVPRFWGISVLDDQAAGGMIMWTLSSEMVVWAVIALLGGAFGAETKPASQQDAGLLAATPGSRPGRAAPAHWRQLAEARLHTQDVS